MSNHLINHIPGTNLHIADQIGVCDINQLRSYDIKHVFNVSAIVIDEFPGISYNYISIWDDPSFDIISVIEKLCPVLENIDENIVINCQAGISRSASVIIGYLIYKGSTYEDAYDLLKSCRDIIKPNGGFITSLRKYELKIKSV